MENHLKKMQALLEEGTSFVSATLVEIKGSTPRAQGGRMLLLYQACIPVQLEVDWLRQRHWNLLRIY